MADFSLGAILSVTTGVLLCDFAEVHELLDHMTGDTLFTHQLPRASRECEDHLRAQFPQLADIEVPVNLPRPELYLQWVESLHDLHGARHEVAPLPPGDHTRIDPLTEMALHHPGKPVIAVEVRDDHA